MKKEILLSFTKKKEYNKYMAKLSLKLLFFFVFLIQHIEKHG